VQKWVADNRLNLAHWFTVDDLMFLFRGGRVSKTSAWAGTLLKIKPVLHVDDEGKLIPMQKIRGRKKSIEALFDMMKKTAIQPVSDQEIFISHGDCLEDVEHLEKLIRDEWNPKLIFHNILDPVIGAHAGPGTVALFFLADHR
jgi:DegV family protein with EDD domain